MILVLAGTSEARRIIPMLNNEGYNVIATVTTPYGGELIKDTNTKILVGSLEKERLEKVIIKNKIKAVVDITHPYAQKISNLSQNACKKFNIPYIRYERAKTTIKDTKNIIKTKNFENAAIKVSKINGRIFLTTGSNNLPVFLEYNKPEKFIVRILPLSEKVKKCEKLGIMPESIIAIKGPLSTLMNYQMFKDFKASAVVTKDSGIEGGTLEKIEAAQKLNIPIIIIERPNLNYGKEVENINDLIKEINTYNIF